MNRVFIDKNAQIAVKNELIVIDDIKIPLRAVDMIICWHKCAIDLRDISLIAKADVPILVVTSKPKEFILVQKRYSKNGELKLWQYHALDRRLDIAKSFVANKIANAYKILRRFDLDVSFLEFEAQLNDVSSVETLLGIEGKFAKRYFSYYFSLFPKALAKGTRTKNPPQDPVNALLSYIYTIYYYEIATWLNYYGFEPTIGYLHTPFRDHYALASDILELFRSAIDAFVAKLFLDGEIVLSDFTKRSQIRLTDTGRKKLWPHLKTFFQEQEPKLKKELAHLRNTVEKSYLSKQMQK